MDPLQLAALGCFLVVSVAAGTTVHELLHATALRLFRIPYRLEWLPGRGGNGVLLASLTHKWAVVTPRTTTDASPWAFRIAALAPMAQMSPFVLVAVGVIPDPFAADAVLFEILAIAMMACSLPSPQDFALFWNAEQAVAEYGTSPVPNRR